MRGLDPQRTNGFALGDTGALADDNHVRHLRDRANPRRHSGDLANTPGSPVRIDGAVHAVSAAERRLFGVLRENKTLRINNEHLMRALDDASRRAVAAQRVAQHDGLTGLPNRLLLIKRLQLAIRNASQRHRQLALLFIDLDGFKIVNDHFGHRTADRLLSAVAARIAASVRDDDIACRYGGDEFVVLLSNLTDSAIATSIAEKIRRHIGEDYLIDGKEIRIGASIGLAVYPTDGLRYDALLNCADATMYSNKASRRAQSAITKGILK